MTQSIRDAARALYSACCNYGSQREQDIRDAVKAYELAALRDATSAPQPTADERVAEHMRLVDEHAAAYYSTFLGTFVGPEEASPRKVTHAAVEQSARALLSASQEDAKQQARLVELVLCMGASREQQDWADLHIDLSEAISIAEALKEKK